MTSIYVHKEIEKSRFQQKSLIILTKLWPPQKYVMKLKPAYNGYYYCTCIPCGMQLYKWIGLIQLSTTTTCYSKVLSTRIVSDFYCLQKWQNHRGWDQLSDSDQIWSSYTINADGRSTSKIEKCTSYTIPVLNCKRFPVVDIFTFDHIDLCKFVASPMTWCHDIRLIIACTSLKSPNLSSDF